MLICQPYKSELHQYWRFKTDEPKSASKIYKMFLQYIDNDEFVGRDNEPTIYIWVSLVVVDIGIIVQVRNGSTMVNGKYYHMIELKKDFMILV